MNPDAHRASLHSNGYDTATSTNYLTSSRSFAFGSIIAK